MTEFYISSTKYNVQERQTAKHGKVYDVVFRIITHEGIEKQKKLSGYKTKKLAGEAYTAFVTEKCELLKGAKRITQTKVEKENPNIERLFKEHIAQAMVYTAESTIHDRKRIFERYVLPTFGEKKMRDLTDDAIKEWQTALHSTIGTRGKRLSHKYCTSIRSHFSSFCGWCEEHYGYPSPFKKVKAIKKNKNDPKYSSEKTGEILSREEIDKFLSVIDNPMYKCLFTVMAYTGRRKGEIFALKKEYFKTDADGNNYIRFYRQITRKNIDGSPWKENNTKVGKDQLIPICKRVSDALAEYGGDKPYFFGGERPLAENTVMRNFNKYIAKAEVNPITEHGLRHSFVSMLIHNGANIYVVAELIGDTPEQVLKTYGHLYKGDCIEAVNRL